MGAHRKNERANAMYEAYESGLSLAEVGEMFGVTRQSVYAAFKRRGLELRPKPQPLPAIIFGGRKYTMRNTGYYGATEGDRGLLHRHMWEAANGPIPENYDIHHIDGNKTHNAVSNFECLPKSEHARLYGAGCNQFHHRCEKRAA